MSRAMLDSTGLRQLMSDGMELLQEDGDPCCCNTFCYKTYTSSYDCALDAFTTPVAGAVHCYASAAVADQLDWVITGSYPTCTATILVQDDDATPCGADGDCTDLVYTDPTTPTGCEPDCSVCCQTLHVSSPAFAGVRAPGDGCYFDFDVPRGLGCSWSLSDGGGNPLVSLELANCVYTATLNYYACAFITNPDTGNTGEIDCQWVYSVNRIGACPGLTWTQTGKSATHNVDGTPADPALCPDLSLTVTCVDPP